MEKSINNVIKPLFDKRNIIAGELINNVKYSIINDKLLDKSIVYITIKTGSFNNPKDCQGLSHFLEHLLFMGSKKYPNEDHFNKRISHYNGSSNAYTKEFETIYFFSVIDSGLGEILDIFSHFFIDPLFSESMVSREINAINNEHLKNIHNDYWKQYQLELYLTNKNSNTNTFPTGSKKTLNNPNIRSIMIDYFNKYYSAENISISIATSKDPEIILRTIASTFGNIKGNSNNQTIITKPIYSENMNESFYIKSSNSIYQETIIWETDIQTYEKNIYYMIAFIVSYNHPKSLNHVLKNMGLINGIFAGYDDKMGVFKVQIDYTKKGYQNIKLVENYIFYYIRLIKEAKYVLFEYINKISKFNFKYNKKINNSSLAELLSTNHHYVNSKNIFASDYYSIIMPTHDEIRNILNQIDTNFIRIFMSKNLPEKTNTKYEKINNYEAFYTKIQFHNNLNKTFNIELFDTFNKYINIKPKVIDVKETISNTMGTTSKFNEPIIYSFINCYSNNYFKTVQNFIKTTICISVLNFIAGAILNDPLLLAFKLSFEKNIYTSSIIINISGFNDIKYYNEFIADLINFIKDKKSDKISTEYIKNKLISLKEAYENINNMSPYEYFYVFFGSKLFDTSYSQQEVLGAIDKISVNDINEHIDTIFDNITVNTFTFGNIKDKIKYNLESNDIKYVLPKFNIVKPITIKHPNKDEKSICISYNYYIDYTFKNYVIALLIDNIISVEFYNELRTKKQLGYIVNMSIHNIMNNLYMSQIIQSDKSPNETTNAIDGFNRTIIDKIKNISNLEDIKKNVYDEINTKETRTKDLYNIYSSEILSRNFIFNRKELLLKEINDISIDDIIEFTKKYIIGKEIKYMVN